MAPPNEPTPPNPYQEQTEANTSTEWLDGHEPVDADLDGLVDYGKSMVTVKGNLDDGTGYLHLLGSKPAEAWEGGVLGEAGYVAQKMVHHYAELQQFFQFMSQGLNNIGMAAQTVADAFQGTDGWSAATLDAVRFAYGDSRVPAPSGLPPGFAAKTWMDTYLENIRNGTGAGSGQLDQWELQSSTGGGPGSVMTYINQHGATRTVSSYYDAGVTRTTTTLRDPDGNVISTSSESSSTRTVGNTVVNTRTTYDGDGNETGSTVERTVYSGGEVVSQSTADYGADGELTGVTTHVTHGDGTQTVTTSQGDERQVVEVGEQTEGEDAGQIESPAQDAQERIEDHNYPTAPWALGG